MLDKSLFMWYHYIVNKIKKRYKSVILRYKAEILSQDKI